MRLQFRIFSVCSRLRLHRSCLRSSCLPLPHFSHHELHRCREVGQHGRRRGARRQRLVASRQSLSVARRQSLSMVVAVGGATGARPARGGLPPRDPLATATRHSKRGPCAAERVGRTAENGPTLITTRCACAWTCRAARNGGNEWAASCGRVEQHSFDHHKRQRPWTVQIPAAAKHFGMDRADSSPCLR